MASSKAFVVVDDDPVWTRLAQLGCSPYGKVLIASNIAQAFPLLKGAERLLGLVTDLRLPDGSGFELLETQRRDGVRAPALVMTSYPDGENLRKAHRLGAEFVCKPVSIEQLEQFARRAVGWYWSEDMRVGRLVDELARRCSLSPRETELAAMSAAGIPRDLQADEFGVSVNTLKSQVRKLLLKTGFTSLDELGQALLRSALAGAELTLPQATLERRPRKLE